jgi:HemK-related putative methylase
MKMYEPQEDSLMLNRVLKNFLSDKKLDLCIDMGCGSGIQGLLMSSFSKKVLFVDINFDAISYVSDLVKHKKNCFVIKSDLFSNVSSKFKGMVDLIAFNPPYLPRESLEVDDLELTSGIEGVDLTLRFLCDCVSFLKPSGRLFFVASSLANISLIESKLVELNFKFDICAKEHIFFEDIIIFEAWRI